MFIKVVSIIIATCILQVSLLAGQSPADPLFYFISGNFWVIVGRLLLIAALLLLAFRGRFIYSLSRPFALISGALLVLVGSTALISQTVFFAFSTYLKVFDYILLVELGVMYALAALTYTSAMQPLSLRRFGLRRVMPAVFVKPGAELAPIGRRTRRAASAKGS